jgi:pimeloyl-ACP methyl ester carboxylesterase
VHLVGHSYGGGFALRVAADRPECVASLTLYEPSAFHLLRQAGPDRLEHLVEIEALARAVGEGIVRGAYLQAAQTFVDYWNGEGSWRSMRPDVRAALVKWLPKAPLDFQALIMDDTPLESVRRIACPVLLLRGEFAKGPSRSICEILAEHLPEQLSAIVAGACHMGPISHADEVDELVRGHLWSQMTGQSDGEWMRAVAA